jgi:hypothetical protein
MSRAGACSPGAAHSLNRSDKLRGPAGAGASSLMMPDRTWITFEHPDDLHGADLEVCTSSGRILRTNRPAKLRPWLAM